MSLTIIIGVAALYLAVIPPLLDTTNFLSRVVFKSIPMVLAILLGSVAFGRFMGWPLCPPPSAPCAVSTPARC